MTRRGVLGIALASLLYAKLPEESVRGRLRDGVLTRADGKTVKLTGDAEALAVLADSRLAGLDIEAIGRFTAPERFEVNPSYTKNLFVHKDGKRFTISYWCEICSIRTFTPGKCMCCQEETDLSLQPVEP